MEETFEAIVYALNSPGEKEAIGTETEETETEETETEETDMIPEEIVILTRNVSIATITVTGLAIALKNEIEVNATIVANSDINLENVANAKSV